MYYIHGPVLEEKRLIFGVLPDVAALPICSSLSCWASIHPRAKKSLPIASLRTNNNKAKITWEMLPIFSLLEGLTA